MTREKLKAHVKLCAKDPLWWLLLLCITLSLFFNIRERLGLGTPSKWGGWLCIATGTTVLGSCVRKIFVGSSRESTVESRAALGALAILTCLFGIDVLLM